MALLDAIVRFSAVGLLLNLALLALLRSAHLVLRIGGLLMISIAAVLINSSSFEVGAGVRLFLKVLETPNVALLWWFGLALFQDDFKLRAPHWVGMVASCLLGLSLRIDIPELAAPLADWRLTTTYVLSFALMGHLLWSVLRDSAGDLVNARRSARFWAVIGFVVISIGIGVAEIALPHEAQSFLRAALLWPIAVACGVWLTPIRPERIVFQERPARAPQPGKSPALDYAIASKLQKAMNDDQVYLEHGLTVARLAAKIAVPEHRLRAHINGETGFRNFSAYVNHFRLEAAKASLRDSARAKEGMLAIALDVGFASLATFNRVFKAVEGSTPSAYRQQHAGDRRQD